MLAAGVAANAAFSAAFSGLPMTAVLMRSAYRLDNPTLGLMLGLMGLGIALSELPWGLLTDRLGDRPVLLAGLGSTSLALLAMALWATPAAASLRALGLGLLGVGLLGGSVNGASGRAIMIWFASGERGLAMSIRQTAVPLGGGLGALLLPALALKLGFAWLYLVLGLLCAAAAGLCWAWIHEPPMRPLGAGPAAPGPVARPLGSPLKSPRIWQLAAGIGLLCAPQFAVISFGTVFLHDFALADLVFTTTAMVLRQLGAMGLRVWSGRWTDRHQNRPTYLRRCTLWSAGLFLALAVLSLGLGHGGAAGLGAWAHWSLGGLLLAAGLSVSAWHGVAYTELGTLAGARQSGTALGMANTSVFVVCFLTPLLIPHLQGWQGWPLVWAAAAGCALGALPLLAPAGTTAQASTQVVG